MREGIFNNSQWKQKTNNAYENKYAGHVAISFFSCNALFMILANDFFCMIQVSKFWFWFKGAIEA